MKLAIISFAHMHAFSYAKAIQSYPGAKLAGIYDDDPNRGERAAEDFNTQYYESLDVLLSTDIDAVIITSENSMHKVHTVAAARAGKHVLCEKPLATNIEDSLEMIRTCKENNIILQTAFPVRFSSPVLRAKTIIDSGELGEVLAIKGTNRGTNPGGWFIQPEFSGGGAVIDHTVHVVDIMRWFLKSEVKEVYAEVDNRFVSEKIDDCGILSMEFDNGTIATLDCSWSRNPSFPTWGDVTLEIVGTKGTLSVDAFAQKIDVFNERGHKYHYWGDEMDAGLMGDFIESIKEERIPSISGLDGLKALEVALAAYKSSRQKEPIQLSQV
ncbi:Gfo/Idh/MocA family oxidoreductase [Mesobacillus subterraneus]|uniref:Gfo/Idh/MocA family protein n=1 Tax=Mesobacillus subterraneus TaxID=285983 RepID=UPI00203A3BAD|nr:Gfo/Idh/MocA family oxidoreductase [Mesobacillus subterraneus]MCM3667010.1 Gfo/Idh/MocA family oxidoreductase [Mesobacillus subterraneus]MCM3685841.1 Gfo/Idh/MocA family oxidoreductase [Mesobacillus subterraneus]